MTAPLNVTNAAARQFLLSRHGLSGRHRFHGVEGILAFVSMVGGIQFDPIDICGRNSDLVLQSRVAGYRKEMLWHLLYRERTLVDYFDKELCIFPSGDWPLFARTRNDSGDYLRSHEEVEKAIPQVLAALAERGPSTARELDDGTSVDWYWGNTRLARATLEYLYYAGNVGIASKKGTAKRYDLIGRLLPEALLTAPDPFPDEAAFQRHFLLRRIGAIGLLWNRASPAWLGLGDFKTQQRNAAFAGLLSEGVIVPVQVDGLKDTLFVRAEEAEALQAAATEDVRDAKPRCELIAPLDNLLWDRALIKALFDFSYTWEVYTPPAKRLYGHYVLPVLYGSRFIARAEPVIDRKTSAMTVRGLWPEDGIDLNKAPYRAALADCLDRFARFHRESVENGA